MFINGKVRTNVDWLKRKIWPARFISTIRTGDYIEASDKTRARIVSITHTDKDAIPCLIIEVWAEPKT